MHKEVAAAQADLTMVTAAGMVLQNAVRKPRRKSALACLVDDIQGFKGTSPEMDDAAEILLSSLAVFAHFAGQFPLRAGATPAQMRELEESIDMVQEASEIFLLMADPDDAKAMALVRNLADLMHRAIGCGRR